MTAYDFKENAQVTSQATNRKLTLLSLAFLGILTGCFLYPAANADTATEKIYLTQVVNQLNAMQPLILAAQRAQPSNQRIQFHYTKYKDSKGQLRNGLLEDVQAIKKGIEAQLNSTTVEPRVFQPIQGDYLDQTSNHENIP